MALTVIIFIINFYQKYLSLDRGVFAIFAPAGACKFELSCSEYTKKAVLEYGIIKGLSLGFRRVLSCR